MSKVKSFLDALFNSPYLSKIDVAALVAAGVLVFNLHVSAVQEQADILILASVFMVAKAVENALPSK